MSRAEWTALALALAKLRGGLADHARRARRPETRAAHIERLKGVDLAARTICATLRQRSTRFDGRRFMRIVTTGAAK